MFKNHYFPDEKHEADDNSLSSPMHSVCTFKTSPCMPAKRAHVFQHVRVMPVHAGRFWTYRRGRVESTHGVREEGGWSSPSFCLPRLVYVELSLAQEVIQSCHRIIPIFKFESRSRTTRSRFLQSFALPHKAVQLQLS